MPWLLGTGLPSARADQAASEAEFLDLSLEELMHVVVTTASRKSQTLARTAAAVHVISAEEIRRSGASNLPEALRLAPGVQVAAISHNKWSVSIRGFPGRYSNKLLVLVDGRSIYSPLFSGVFWEFNDIPLENIERIEVIRGPGSSVWGANAVNGVINIITKSARDTLGDHIDLALGDEKRAAGYVRHGWAPSDDTSVRIHVKARDVEPSIRHADGRAGEDDWHAAQAGFRLDRVGAGDTLSIQGGLYDSRAGDSVTAYDFAGSLPPRVISSGNNGQGGHLMARWERVDAAGERRSLQGYVERSTLDYSGLAEEQRVTLDLEYQHQARVGATQELVWGFGYRFSRDRQTDTDYVRFDPDKYTTHLWSAFVQDEITLVPERWALTLGSRLEHNEYSGFEIQPNIRLSWTPTPHDSYWGALSRGTRTPSRGETNSMVALTPPMPLVMVSIGDPSMDSEKINALDLGWRRQWTPHVSSDFSAFAYHYSDLRGSIMGLPTLAYIPFTLTNDSKANLHGAELFVDWRVTQDWRLRTGYSWLKVKESKLGQGIGSASEVEGTTPTGQFSLQSSLDISPSLRWDMVLRHVDALRLRTLAGDMPIDAYTELDMRLAWQSAKNLEISLVGQNLFNESHMEFVDSHIASAPSEVERSVRVVLDWKF
jgi:iron complex outermembrane receptor protein